MDSHGKGTTFPLNGTHRYVECAKCHPLPNPGAKPAEARYAGTPKTCEGCHPDPHRGQMRSPCSACHREDGWKSPRLLFVHNKDSEFKIVGDHAGLACAACHKEGKAAVYRPLPKTCEGCHADVDLALRGTLNGMKEKADPHAVRVACAKCHVQTATRSSLGDYAVTCRSCHNPRYEGLLYDWEKTLRERESQAEGLLQALRARKAPEAAALADKIARAKAVGIHNVQLARKLWDEAEAQAGAAPQSAQPQKSGGEK